MLNDHERALLDQAEQQVSYPPLLITVSGAHLYGFPSPDSDFDLRGAHILPLDLVVGLDDPEETITYTFEQAGRESDLVSHDIKKFLKDLTIMCHRSHLRGFCLEGPIKTASQLVCYLGGESPPVSEIARTRR